MKIKAKTDIIKRHPQGCFFSTDNKMNMTIAEIIAFTAMIANIVYITYSITKKK